MQPRVPSQRQAVDHIANALGGADGDTESLVAFVVDAMGAEAAAHILERVQQVRSLPHDQLPVGVHASTPLGLFLQLAADGLPPEALEALIGGEASPDSGPPSVVRRALRGAVQKSGEFAVNVLHTLLPSAPSETQRDSTTAHQSASSARRAKRDR
jgi:hypothetical protein